MIENSRYLRLDYSVGFVRSALTTSTSTTAWSQPRVARKNDNICWTQSLPTKHRFTEHPTTLTGFSKEFIPEISKRHRRGERDNTLRVWSAACATGPEAYTIVLCLHDLRAHLDEWQIDVIASDLSTASLDAAKQATYNARVMDTMTSHTIRRFFKKIEGPQEKYTLKSEFCEQVEFFHHNLMKPLVGPPMDCIFLRNVLIYFDEKSKEQVIQNMSDSLVPGGYLVVGPSEGIYGLKNPLNKRETFLYQKPV